MSAFLERLRERWLGLLDRIPERLRWSIALLVDRVTGNRWCWPHLATWAMYGPSDQDRALPWAPPGQLCRDDAATVGCCWCGRLRDPEGERRWRDEHIARLRTEEES